VKTFQKEKMKDVHKRHTKIERMYSDMSCQPTDQDPKLNAKEPEVSEE